jgi:hypothetical protein
MKTDMIFRYFMILLLFIILGCSPAVYSFFNNTNPSTGQIAILKNQPGIKEDKLALVEFDGVRNKENNWGRYGNPMDWSFQINILPGPHSALVTLFGAKGEGFQYIKIEFIAEAGKTYYLKQKIQVISSSVYTTNTGPEINEKYDVRAWIEE